MEQIGLSAKVAELVPSVDDIDADPAISGNAFKISIRRRTIAHLERVLVENRLYVVW